MCVSMMTHHEARYIEAGALWGSPSFQPLVLSVQNSTRNTLGSRNHHNSPDVNDIIFSNRNKMRGVDGQKSALSASRTFLRDEEFPKTLPGLSFSGASSDIQPLTSNLCSFLIATLPNRNRLNSPAVNKTCPSNRNNRKGSRGPGEGRTGEMRAVFELPFVPPTVAEPSAPAPHHSLFTGRPFRLFLSAYAGPGLRP